MILKSRPQVLFLVLGAFFVANALTAEFIGVKVFSVERSLGLSPLDLSLFGVQGLSLHMSAGVLLWPVVFIMTDIINEYYGPRGVRFLSYLTVILILYAFLMIFWSMELAPSDFWLERSTPQGTVRMDLAYNAVFGQGLWIIAGSITAFLIGQISDVLIFHRIKRATGQRALWLRATGSTVVSQFIDSFVVILIAFYWGAGWDLNLVLAVGLVNYSYKFLVAIFLTPLLYVLHAIIDRYLGKDRAKEMVLKAAEG